MVHSSEGGSERRKTCVSVRTTIAISNFNNVVHVEVKLCEEGKFGRCGVKVAVNDCEFRVGIRFQVEEFLSEVMHG